MEQFADKGAAVINNGGVLTSGATSVTVASEFNVPATGTFRVLIDDELIKVTAVATHVWTIVRAQGGTSAAAHSDGSNIYLVATKDALDELVCVKQNGTEISNRRFLNFKGALVTDNTPNADIVVGPAWESVYTPPVLGSYTQVNMGSGSDIGTASSSGLGVFLRDSVQSSTWGDHARLLYIATPSPPWTLIAKLVPFTTGANYQTAGLCFYDSSSHKMADIRSAPQAGGFIIGKWTDYTAYSADYKAFSAYPMSNWTWFKLQDDNTNRKISASMDGTNWILLHTIGRTDFLTANAAAFFVNANNNNGTQPYDAGALLLSWSF